MYSRLNHAAPAVHYEKCDAPAWLLYDAARSVILNIPHGSGIVPIECLQDSCVATLQNISASDTNVIVTHDVAQELRRQGAKHVYCVSQRPEDVLRSEDGRAIGHFALVKMC